MSLRQHCRKFTFLYLTVLLILFVFRQKVVNHFARCEMKSVKEIKALAAIKYADRRELIRNFCDQNPQTFMPLHLDKSWETAMYFDYDHTLLYCPVNKVASSTWATNLMELKGYDVGNYIMKLVNEGFKQNERRPEMKKRLFSLQDDSIDSAAEKLVSFAFVRDPFDRFVSCYHNKMISSNWPKQHDPMRPIRDEILIKYRNIDPSKSYESPTPQEFAQYVIESANEIGANNLNRHMRPIWMSCPFCTLDFDIIGQLETFDEDANFIIENLRLDIPSNVHKNHASKSTSDKKSEFFKQIPDDMIRQLYQIYEMDFLLFGYAKPDTVQ